MRQSVVAIYDNNKNDFVPAVPYVYNGTSWVPLRGKVYNSGWKDIGGAGELFYYFLEHTGLNYDSTDNLLVREHNDRDRWIDRDGKVMNMTDHYVTTGSAATLQMKLIPREEKFFTLKDSSGNILKDTNGSNHTELVVYRRL